MGEPEAIEFFISYTGPDRSWAEWIAWQLEDAGFSTRLQAWDFRPGNNFILEMNDAMLVAKRTIAVLSPAFLESPYTSAEWAAAFAEDPTGRRAKLIPVRVRECEPKALLGPIVYADLVGKGADDAAEALIGAVSEGRAIPSSAPAFPGAPASREANAAWFPGAGPPIWNIPIGTRLFEGRAEALDFLTSQMHGAGRAAVTQTHAVHGLGGVGKTQLAARFARDHQDDYDVVWWVRAEEETTRLQDFSDLGAKLGLPEAIERNQAALIKATRDWLAASNRWLLVFDNVPDPRAISALMPDGHAGHILITSRRHADWRALGATPLPLNVWRRAESVAFLIKRTGDEDVQAADAIAGLLGDLPLALEQAAAYSNQQAIRLRAYQDRLGIRGPALLRKGQPFEYEHTVLTAWDLAFTEIDRHPLAAYLLRLCAVLAPERIPRELLTDLAVRIDDAEAAPSSDAIDDAIEQLLNYALVSPAEDESVDMHRLVQQVVRDRDTAALQRSSIEAAVMLVLDAMPGDCWRPERWQQCARLLPHVLAAIDHAETSGAAPTATATLAATAAIFLAAHTEFVPAKGLFERAVAISEAAHGPDAIELAGILGNLGNLLHELGELPAARAALERALAIEENAYGPGHPAVASSLVQLGNVLVDSGCLPEAHAAIERALAIQEDLYGSDHPELAHTLNNLGILLTQTGELPDARTAFERALVIKERVHGLDSSDVAKTLGNLGSLMYGLGDLSGARDIQARVLAIEERAYGPDHPEVGRSLGNLAGVLASLGELGEARSHDGTVSRDQGERVWAGSSRGRGGADQPGEAAIAVGGVGSGGDGASAGEKHHGGPGWVGLTEAWRSATSRAPQTPIATYFVSKYSPIPSNPPSRPNPDCLTPPNGAAALDTTPWLSPTMPVSSCSQT